MKITRLVITSCVAASLLAGLATRALAADDASLLPDKPYSFETAYGRLPKDVVPSSYTIAIVPHVSAKTIDGTESVALDVRSSDNKIVFNTLDDTLTNVTFDGKPVASTTTDNTAQLTTVMLTAPASPGKHTLAFSYTAKIVVGTPQGLFYQPYQTPDGKAAELLSTQFESTDARRMFPCWDEPAFRASFTLTATVPAAWQTTSNMPPASRTVNGDVATTTFEPTPKMPTYLVEFTAGDLASITATSGGKNFGVWAVKGREHEGEYALANAQQILADYDDYFGYTFPLPKLDSIAIPGGFGGAMENWGAITYNDSLLLVNPSSTVGDKQDIFSVQAHEMAHQWNGDLVTMGWWDDLWLNESFASWRSAKETDLRNPTWKWWEGQDDDKERAMTADARVNSHPIRVHVTDELQANNAFDPAITYSKGQAFLRMLEAYLGPDTFRDGIRRYIKARAFSNATAPDLWTGLSAASGKDVGALSANWIGKPGFPIVSADATCDANGARTITLTQKRYLSSGADPNPTIWQVPLSIRSGADGKAQSVLLTTNGQTAPAGRCDEPLSIDADSVGYYRSKYDDATLALDRKDFQTLPDGDKIALLDDQWALGSSGATPLSPYLGFASSMGADTDTRAWQQITSSLGSIEYDERGTAGHDAFTAYARSVIMPLRQKLGWDAKSGETPGTVELRRVALDDLGAWGDATTLAEARSRFKGFLSNPSSLTNEQQEIAVSIVAPFADQTTFDAIHKLARASTNDAERRRYYLALMHVRDPQLAEQALTIGLSSEIPPQDEQQRIGLVGTIGDYHPAFFWKSFTANADRLLKPMGTFEPIVVAQYIPELAWNTAPAATIEAWAKARVPAEMTPNLARGMEALHFKVAQKAILDSAADAYVVQHDSKMRLGAPQSGS